MFKKLTISSSSHTHKYVTNVQARDRFYFLTFVQFLRLEGNVTLRSRKSRELRALLDGKVLRELSFITVISE